MTHCRRRRSQTVPEPELIGAIDQGTSSTRFLVFENGTRQLIASSQIEVKRIVPQEGWVEMDPDAIIQSVNQTISDVCQELGTDRSRSPDLEHGQREQLISRLKCIGICNQRESTVVWDSVTGQALYNVILWMDNRTKDIVDQMIDSAPGRDFNFLKDKTGLPMSTYFSAFKLKWLIDNVPEVNEALKQNRLMFGTVDSWILWKLTGQHLTDVTNASRTFLMDIQTLYWDKQLCERFNIPMRILPKILASADNFGEIQHGPLKGLPITGVIGDQSAALFGHSCLQLGQTKATFGTGCFIMQNIGPGPLNGALSGVQRSAKRGLITTVGFKLKDKPACYALEGSIKIAGAALTWMRDNMQLIKDYTECDQLINQTSHSAGVFFVPALGGLYSPYWDPNAAGLFIGLSQFTRREHLIRATFDSIAFQTNDILSLMRGVTSGLMIDGGLCKSDNMCQILADVTGCDIVRPSMCETSALGAAMVAGCGADIWSYEDILSNSVNPCGTSSYLNQNHHYPHESLHYEDKFSFRIQSKKLAHDIAHPTLSGTRSSVANLDAGGGGVNDDAGGGQVPLSLPSISGIQSDQEDDGDDECSQCVSSDTEDNLLTITTSAESSASSEEVKSEPAKDPYESNQIEDLVDTDLLKPTTQHSHRTPSSGYSSGDNLESIISACNEQNTQRDSPISSSQIADCVSCDNGTTMECADEPAQQQTISNQSTLSGLAQSFPTNLSSCLQTFISPKDDPAPLSTGTSETSSKSVDETAYQSSASFWSAQLSREPISPQPFQITPARLPTPVDVFQSYITYEHRADLVNTWRLAVERSMKWTKIHHEEIRQLDYQRLASLPISMYLFFSVGMLALSGLISMRQGFM